MADAMAAPYQCCNLDLDLTISCDAGQVVATAGEDGTVTVLKLDGSIVPAGVMSGHKVWTRVRAPGTRLLIRGEACVWPNKRLHDGGMVAVLMRHSCLDPSLQCS